MSDFTDFLIERGLISNLMKRYKINVKDNEVNDFILKMVENLSEIDSIERYHREQGNDQSFDLDTVAKWYEEIVPHTQRKTIGEFFTPIQIVDYILKSIGYTDKHDIENKKLIDLSCGSGSFLIRAVNILLKKLIKQIKSKENSEITPKQAEEIITKIKDNINGIDINPIACILCQVNLYFTLFGLFKIIVEDNKDYHIAEFSVINKDSLQYKFTIKYDYVVGNPPYLFIRAIPQEYRKLIEKLPLETNKGQYDYYQLFIEIGINILGEGGTLGYIIPDSLLVLSNRKIIRKYIYHSTRIKEICYLGLGFKDPVVSNVILVLQRESQERERLNNKILIKQALKNDQLEYYLKQYNIGKWDYKFLINLTQRDIIIFEQLKSGFPKLIDLMNDSPFKILISRGVELGKNGEIIYCEVCNKNLPLPKGNLVCYKCGSSLNSNSIDKIIVDSIPKELENVYVPFVYSLNRYVIRKYKYIKLGVEGINYKSHDVYKNKIVIRQLSQENMICAAYDESAFTSQSIYNLKIIQSNVLEFNHYYLLGLLNSQLLSYYLIKSFSSYKTLFPRILIEKLWSLPVKIPESKEEKRLANKIIDLVKKISISCIKDNNLYIRLQNSLDSLIFDLYNISEDQRLHISNFIKLGKKSN
ncbi:MAG: N-6 DNA methylase [Candidatus Lokiarchaeota archaeon]|nr:N-6 DNA methylase [Candidatus Lokiarchaeota archaeon]